MDDTSSIIQGSDDWHRVRLGRVTASRVADVIARTKSGWGASRANYMAELIAERLTGVPASSYTSAAMQWGCDQEANARAAYAEQTFDAITEIGFVIHPNICQSGASPDGCVGGSGLIEIKSPNTSTHIDTLLSQKIPEKYVTQMTWQMACTGRAWCDYISFDPRLPENMRLFVKRLERDDKRISEMEEMVQEFLAELDAKVTALKALYEKEAT